MKNLFLFLISIAFLFASCSKKELPAPKLNLEQNEIEMVKSNSEFAFDLIKEVTQSTGEDNVLLSPYSIQLALSMTLNGAAGNTQTDMINTLGFQNFTSTDVNKTNKKITDFLLSADPATTLNIANSIWYKHDFFVEQAFIDTNQYYYSAQVNPIDFSDPAAKGIINNWVASNTNNKIEEIVDQISPQHVMFLINAIYFKGNWKYQFDDAETNNMSFTRENGGSVTVPMMTEKMDVMSFDDTLLSAIELPYGNTNFSMVFMLPFYNKTSDDIVQALNLNYWNSINNSMIKNEDLSVYVPRFEFEFEQDLNDALSAMGMGIAFSNLADFSGINAGGGLKIDKVKHKTFIKVDEEGTEAAAATSVGIVYTSINQFMLDRPFVFAIKEKNTNTILFIGKLMDPS